jgi:hypothetical protein
MNNKLHIFGCSYSTNLHCDEFEPPKPFWGKLIADKFDLILHSRTGQHGLNSEYILLDIFDRILNNEIQKNDLVILNTSYPLRFGTPRLQKYSKHPVDTYVNLKKFLGLSGEYKIDDLDSNLTFELWYKQTYGAYKLLESVCDNVYQWTILDIEELDSMYHHIESKIKTEKNIFGMQQYPYRKTMKKNTWKNLLKHPKEKDINNWDEWIRKHRWGSSNYGHLHPNSHPKFADLFSEQIELGQ